MHFSKEETNWEVGHFISVAQFVDAIALTRANNNGFFAPGTGPIFLDNVGCRGNETHLAGCPHRGVNVHNCFHSEDAGVICPQGKSIVCVCMVFFFN